MRHRLTTTFVLSPTVSKGYSPELSFAPAEASISVAVMFEMGPADGAAGGRPPPDGRASGALGPAVQDLLVLDVITGLDVGGAEAMLAKIIETHEFGIRHRVISLQPPGPLGRRIAARSGLIDSLNMRRGLPGPAAVARLLAAVRAAKPELIQGWMYHGNLAASAACLARRNVPLIWNIRHSLTDMALEKPLTRAIIRLSARISRRPAAIIYNSHAAARQHAALGFDASRAVIIPNGFDCDHYRPRHGARDDLVQLFGIDPKAMIVGMVARQHPMKDHRNLVDAVVRCRRRGIDLHLLLVGAGMDHPPADLARAIFPALPIERVTLSPARLDVADWLPGLDLLALPSAWGESFPNILGEAMACGVPCVATDVGDSALILDGAGLIVRPGDSLALANALEAFARMTPEERRRRGQLGRDRVQAHYTLSSVARAYSELYAEAYARTCSDTAGFLARSTSEQAA